MFDTEGKDGAQIALAMVQGFNGGESASVCCHAQFCMHAPIIAG